jgi:hypothetical protein
VLLLFQPLERTVRETISGQELVVMTKTCQPHFSTNTENHLSPQVLLLEAVLPILISVDLTNFEHDSPFLWARQNDHAHAHATVRETR